ncbi:MAG: GAF domain-containing protein [Gammaproteobacteria bacterium]
MLGTLQHIVQQVNEAANLDEALAIIVHRVKEAMAADACSVCIKNATADHYVLMASDGLNPESVGRVQLVANEGLVGLIAGRQELLNLENAADHPAYRYVPETGEERYHSFLGVPLVHFRKVVGVLYIQRRTRQIFLQGRGGLSRHHCGPACGCLELGRAGRRHYRPAERAAPSRWL